MKKDFFKKKIRAEDLIRQMREDCSPQELSLIKKLTRRNRNERFEKSVVG